MPFREAASERVEALPVTRQQEYVTFYSPGTFFAESTTKQIATRDPASATALAAEIIERHGARPYGFRFETRIVAEPISDGAGGTLRVEPKTIDESGIYFIGGKLRFQDDIERDADPKEEVLLSNMRSNGWPIVVTGMNGYRWTQPFAEGDFLVRGDGVIVARGDAETYVAYRKAKIEARKLWLAARGLA